MTDMTKHKHTTVTKLKWWVSPCPLAETWRKAGYTLPYFHEVTPPLVKVCQVEGETK